MIEDKIYKHNLINEIHDYIRVDIDGKIHSLFDEYNISGILDLLNIKIKILNKPIIEKLDEIELKSFNNEYYMKLVIRNNRDKINEIINWINKENKDE